MSAAECRTCFGFALIGLREENFRWRAAPTLKLIVTRPDAFRLEALVSQFGQVLIVRNASHLRRRRRRPFGQFSSGEGQCGTDRQSDSGLAYIPQMLRRGS